MSGLTQENFRGKKQTGAGCANKPHSEHHEHTYNCNGKNCDINGNIRNTNLFDNISSIVMFFGANFLIFFFILYDKGIWYTKQKISQFIVFNIKMNVITF